MIAWTLSNYENELESRKTLKNAFMMHLFTVAQILVTYPSYF